MRIALVFGSFVLLVILVLVLSLSKGNDRVNTIPVDTMRVTYGDTGTVFTRTDASAVAVTARNFLADPRVTPDQYNPNLYTFKTNTTAFSMSYEKTTGFFNITLLERPYGEVRSAAQKYLVGLIGISPAALCTLSYTVTVPGYIDETASGVDYRFAGCSDSLPLP